MGVEEVKPSWFSENKAWIAGCIAIAGLGLLLIGFSLLFTESEKVVEPYNVLDENTGKYDKKFREVHHTPTHVSIVIFIGIFIMIGGLFKWITWLDI